MGTPDFAVASLQALVENKYNVVAVVTSPDKPAGRGRKIMKSAVKEYAKKMNLRILQPQKLRTVEFTNALVDLKADLFIVVAFRMLPEAVWCLPKMGTFNLHASMLPQYRGAAPINWAIINGDKETGLTTFFINNEIDKGNIILRKSEIIYDWDNAGTLYHRLMKEGAKLVIKTVNTIASDDVHVTNQNDLLNDFDELKPAPKIFKEDCKIDWNNNLTLIHNFIRGMSPYPAAWTELMNTETKKLMTLKIFDTEPHPTKTLLNPGVIDTDGKTYLKITARNGYLLIKSLQLQGKRKLPVEDFLRGFDFSNIKIIK